MLTPAPAVEGRWPLAPPKLRNTALAKVVLGRGPVSRRIRTGFRLSAELRLIHFPFRACRIAATRLFATTGWVARVAIYSA